MKHLLFAFVLLCGGTSSLFAQARQYTSAADSDAQAVALLTQLRTKYDGYKTLEAAFRLDIALPGQPVEKQQGTLARQGDQVRFKLGAQEGIITHEAAYLVQHENKEVMISELPEEGEQSGVLTPQTLFDFYERDDYVLSLQGEEMIAGRKVSIIELKPLHRDKSEFTKLRLRVDAAKKELHAIQAFTPDGANFTFTLNSVKGNAPLSANTFQFRPEEFPGYHVEDLRF